MNKNVISGLGGAEEVSVHMPHKAGMEFKENRI